MNEISFVPGGECGLVRPNSRSDLSIKMRDWPTQLTSVANNVGVLSCCYCVKGKIRFLNSTLNISCGEALSSTRDLGQRYPVRFGNLCFVESCSVDRVARLHA